ncbi:hypothetical protein BCR44DRAFT_230767 [Catenaria anguillulae PL171]|uniref:Uncharacterized protein n=1 Tax=Catenaria anguillulae PL171 TaxID=765915 RepID=A0A1Y2HWX9_9FUNG|nr:hypothetical protein BCR44DRAFT_230767 [Catenaria anguillulae PL171]
MHGCNAKNTAMSTLSAIAPTGAVPNLTALPLSPLVFRLLAAKRRVSQTDARLAEKELAGPPSSSAELARLRTMHEDVRMAKDDLAAIHSALQMSSSSAISNGGGPRTWIDIAAADIGAVASALAALEAHVWSASGAVTQLQDAAMSLRSKASGKTVPIADPVNTSRGLPASFIRAILSVTAASSSNHHHQQHPIGQWHAWVDHQLRMVVTQMGPARFSQWGGKLLSVLLGVSSLTAAESSTSMPQIALVPGTLVHALTQHLDSNPDPSIPANKRKPLPALSSCSKPFLPSYQSLIDLATMLRDYALADVSSAQPLDRIPFSEPGILRLVDHATANATDAWIQTLARMQAPTDPARWGLWPIDPPTGAGIGMAHNGGEDGIAIKEAMWLPVVKAKVAHELLMCPLLPL